MIIGFEISKSNYILILTNTNNNLLSYSIPYIGLFKTSLYLINSIDNFKQTILSSENSEMYLVSFF